LFVAVTASAAGYTAVTATSQLTYPVLMLTSASAATLSGPAVVNATLRVSLANMVPTDATFSYVWFHGSGSTATQIAGATESAYVVKPTDLGYPITVVVTMSASGYLTSVYTSNTSDVVR